MTTFFLSPRFSTESRGHNNGSTLSVVRFCNLVLKLKIYFLLIFETISGIYDIQATLRNSRRCSTAKAYLVPAEKRTNLDIVPNALVKKVI